MVWFGLTSTFRKKVGYIILNWGSDYEHTPSSKSLSLISLESKKNGKDLETIQSSTTPDPGYSMGNYQKYNKHHQQEPRGQPFPSRWPQGSSEQTRKHENNKTQKHKWSTKEVPPWNGQYNILLEGLNRFHGPTSPLFQMLIKTHRRLVCMKNP